MRLIKLRIHILLILFIPLFAKAEYEFFAKLGVGIERGQGFRQPTELLNGQLQESAMIEDYGSYVGVRGAEVLEDMKFIWQIDQWITLGNNAVLSYANGLANRDSFVGLSADWGRLRLGRLSNFPNLDMEFINPYEFYSGSNTLWNFIRMDYRLNSAIRYDSPMYQDKFKYMLLYSPDEEHTNGNSKDIFNVGFLYNDQTYFLGYSYFQREDAGSGAGQDVWHRLETGLDNKQWMLVLGLQRVQGYTYNEVLYNEGAYNAQYGTPIGKVEGDELALTGGWYFAKGTLYASYAQGTDVKDAGVTKEDSGYAQYILGYKRPLNSKVFFFGSGGIVKYKGQYAGTTDNITENSIGLALMAIL